MAGRAMPEPDDRARFLREARTLAQVRHPHLVAVHEVIDATELSAFAGSFVVTGKRSAPEPMCMRLARPCTTP